MEFASNPSLLRRLHVCAFVGACPAARDNRSITFFWDSHLGILTAVAQRGPTHDREEIPMQYYLFQWKYKDTSIKAMVEMPQDRPAELRKAVEAFGGRVHQFFFAFGDYDGISIVEFPSNESCAACAVTLTGAGANMVLRTTVLLTANEGQAAMLQASSVQSVIGRL
jgi:uncharacterized protein with GYD domain